MIVSSRLVSSFSLFGFLLVSSALTGCSEEVRSEEASSAETVAESTPYIVFTRGKYQLRAHVRTDIHDAARQDGPITLGTITSSTNGDNADIMVTRRDPSASGDALPQALNETEISYTAEGGRQITVILYLSNDNEDSTICNATIWQTVGYSGVTQLTIGAIPSGNNTRCNAFAGVYKL